jgi:hypothetical protein
MRRITRLAFALLRSFSRRLCAFTCLAGALRVLKIFLPAWLAAAGEEVALQNFSANTRPVFVAIIPSHRALLQNFHHNHIHLLRYQVGSAQSQSHDFAQNGKTVNSKRQALRLNAAAPENRTNQLHLHYKCDS